MNAPHAVLPVTESSQPFTARSAAREAAERMGFSEEDRYRTALVASELATNLLKHASRGGELLVRGLADDAGAAVELIAIDRGPGMSDVEASMRDGSSTTGTLGTGLGAVRRLSDEFDVHSETGRGTAVLARVRAGRAGPSPGRLSVGAVAVPYTGELVSGDGWHVREHEHGFVALLVDGLGHGLSASAAASAALNVFGRDSYSSGLDMLRVIHQGLGHTRGAAATLVDVRPQAGTALVCGVGNVAAVLVTAGSAKSGVALPGILGHQVRQFREFPYSWSANTLLVLHSDGLTTRWSLDAYRGLHTRHPAIIAAVLYRDCSRGRDDATVVVVRGA